MYASFVNYAAEYYGGGTLYKAYAPEKRCSYNHRCEAEHYLTGSHRRGKRALLLTGNGTRKSHKSVRYYKSYYFYCALVLLERGYKYAVIAYRAKQKAVFCLKVKVKKHLTDYHQNCGNDKFS